MPSNYAHYRFGVAQLAFVPADVRKTIQRFRGLYDMGLHGPDIFYYGGALISSGGEFLGIKYHEQTGKEFFSRVCRTVRLERSEAAISYLYGVLCHYCLDSVCHPYVDETAAKNGMGHMELETEFDRMLLEMDGKIPAYAQDLSPHISLSLGECETVSRFYPPAKPKAVRRCVQNMAFYAKLLAAPEGIGRAALEKGAKIIPGEMGDMVMRKVPNQQCLPYLQPMMAWYEQAAETFPVYLEQLREHMTYSAPLGAEFDAKFG